MKDMKIPDRAGTGFLALLLAGDPNPLTVRITPDQAPAGHVQQKSLN